MKGNRNLIVELKNNFMLMATKMAELGNLDKGNMVFVIF